MKEIIVIVRMNRIQKTKNALVEIGCPSMTVNKVLGRGKQRGLRLLRPEIDPEDERWEEAKMKYVPKRMISIIEEDNMVDRVVRTIMEVNRTGEIGDGKIFICPIDDAIRIRTGERGEEAI
jgi:nitrogen regulatory protein PII 2